MSKETGDEPGSLLGLAVVARNAAQAAAESEMPPASKRFVVLSVEAMDRWLRRHEPVLEPTVADVALREAMAHLSQENAALYANLSATQARCWKLMETARAYRKKIMELGGEDPGCP